MNDKKMLLLIGIGFLFSLILDVFSSGIYILFIQVSLMAVTLKIFYGNNKRLFKILLFLFVLVLCIDLKINMAYAWWDANWEFRKNINITNNDANTLKKYHTINFTLDTSMVDSCNKMRIIYNDSIMLNFTFHDATLGNITKESYNGCPSTSSMIYFPLQSDIASGNYDDDYHIYYNTTFTDEKYPNDLDKVFLVYDDFTRSSSISLDNDWIEVVDNADIVGNRLYAQNRNACAFKPFDVGSLTDITGFEIYYMGATNSTTSQGAGVTIRILNGSTNPVICSNSTRVKYGFNPAIEEDYIQIINYTTTSTTLKQATVSFTNGDVNEHRFLRYDFTNNAEYIYWMNGTKKEWNTINYTELNPITSLGGILVAFNNQYASVDNILMRRHINTEPTTTIGNQETRSAISIDLMLNGTFGNKEYDSGDVVNATGVSSVSMFEDRHLLNDSYINYLTFNGNENQTAYFKIQKKANVTDARLNLSGSLIGDTEKLNDGMPTVDACYMYGNIWCSFSFLARGNTLKEISNLFGGNGSTFDVTFRIRSSLTGSDLTTYTTSASSSARAYFYFNLSLTTGNIYYVVASSTASEGLSIGFYTNFTMTPDYSKGIVNYSSDGGSSWNVFGGYDQITTHEYITTGNTTQNIYIDVGNNGDKDWYYSGIFEQNKNRTDNFASSINSYLSTCSEDGDGYCSIPLVFHSDTIGNLKIDDMNVTSSIANLYLDDSRVGINSYIDTIDYGVHNFTFVLLNDNTIFSISRFTNTYVYSEMNMTNCTGGATRFLTFDIKHEDNSTALNGTIEATFNVWDSEDLIRNFSFKVEGNSTYHFCIEPNYLDYTIDAFIQYYSDGYSTRNYFMDDVRISNTTTPIDLFLIPTGDSTRVTINVLDRDEVAQEGVIVSIKRYFIDENVYRTVAMVKTDFEGKSSTYLKTNDIWYSFVLEKAGAILNTYAPSIICQSTPCSITLYTEAIGGAEMWNYFGRIAYSCSVNETTKIIRCDVNDNTGQMLSSNLKVEHLLPLSWNTTCDVTDYSSSSTLVCDLGNVTGDYKYILTASVGSPPVSYILELDSVVFATANIWGETGLLLSFMIIAICLFVGIANPVVSMSFGILGLVVTWILGLYTMSYASVVGIIISMGLIIIKMKA